MAKRQKDGMHPLEKRKEPKARMGEGSFAGVPEKPFMIPFPKVGQTLEEGYANARMDDEWHYGND